MKTFLNTKSLSIFNFIIVTFFAASYLIYIYQIDFVIIGVFREMLTIPFMLAQIVFLFLSIRFLIAEKRFPFGLLLSVIALAICSVLTFGSFF